MLFKLLVFSFGCARGRWFKYWQGGYHKCKLWKITAPQLSYNQR